MEKTHANAPPQASPSTLPQATPRKSPPPPPPRRPPRPTRHYCQLPPLTRPTCSFPQISHTLQLHSNVRKIKTHIPHLDAGSESHPDCESFEAHLPPSVGELIKIILIVAILSLCLHPSVLSREPAPAAATATAPTAATCYSCSCCSCFCSCVVCRLP